MTSKQLVTVLFILILLSSCVATRRIAPTQTPIPMRTTTPTAMATAPALQVRWSNQMVAFNAMAVLPDHTVWTVGQSGMVAHEYLELGHDEYAYYALESGYIDAVDFSSPDDGWITASQGQLYHWDGSMWQNILPPDLTDDRTFYDIKVAGENDAYVAGCNLELAQDKKSLPILLHWDGNAWKDVLPESPHIGSGYCLKQISILSKDDIWIVGGRYGKGIVLHGRGTNWETIAAPDSPDSLNSVSATSDTDVWATSFDEIYHWDGSRWEHWTLPIWIHVPAGKASTIYAVAYDNVWVAGRSLYHWDGSAWKAISLDGYYGPIVDMKMTADSKLWALTSYGVILALGPQR